MKVCFECGNFAKDHQRICPTCGHNLDLDDELLNQEADAFASAMVEAVLSGTEDGEYDQEVDDLMVDYQSLRGRIWVNELAEMFVPIFDEGAELFEMSVMQAENPEQRQYWIDQMGSLLAMMLKFIEDADEE
jgi:hypothetical protein